MPTANAGEEDVAVQEPQGDAERAESYECECIDCGKTVESDEHCKDIKCPDCGGEMRRKERPGPGRDDGAQVERRFTGGPATDVRLETRADGTQVIRGIGAVYYDGTRNTEYEIFPGVRERIKPGAFERVLGEGPDVRGLFNHDINHVLGRTSKGTMTLRSTKAGLEYEIVPPDTSTGHDVLELLKRGDIDGSSFSFSNQTEDRIPDGDEEVFEMRDFGNLYDVGPVTFPAYTATTAGAAMRSMETHRERPEPANPDAALFERARRLLDQ